MKLDDLYKRVILGSVRHGIIVTDQVGLVILANRAAEVILSVQEIGVNQPIAELGLCPEMEKAVLGAVTGMSYFQKQCQLDRAEESKYINWDAVPLTEEDGEVVGAVILFEDITESLSLARQIREWERLATAGEVAAGLAHEIRNPLAAAQGALQLFMLADSEEKRRDLLVRFSEQLDRMNSILTDYLTLVEPTGEDRLKSIDLRSVINEIKFLIRSEAILYNVELIVTPCKAGLPRISGISSSLKQVFLNIAKNALEAMAEGGSLTISLGWDSTHAWVEFKDTGPGIPADHQDNIFRPFFTTKVGGTGLGLAISQRIIKRMDGEIKVLSIPGSGTVVTVYLPALSQVMEVL